MVINNIKIVTLNKIIQTGYLRILQDKIIDVQEGEYNGDETIIDGRGRIALPGFIDVHVHGVNNIDFMYANKEDYSLISKELYKEGVTIYLATTLTSDKDSLINVCKKVKEAKKDNPSLLGIHLEGPYISKKYKGAQNEKFIRPFDRNEIDELDLASGGNIRYITLAVENKDCLENIPYLKQKGITVSVGHSDATFDDVSKAYELGLTNLTHTFNAMSGFKNREPGVVTAGLYYPLYCEVIADGVHVDFETLKTFYKCITSSRLILVTDALKIKNSSIKEFELFGLDCIKKDDAAYLKTGPLAGSILTMDKAIRNMVNIINDISLIDIAKISSYNASKSLGLNDIGEIAINKQADIVLLNDDLTIDSVYKNGEKVY